MNASPIPKVIWTLWLQGWDAAPQVAKASATSWRVNNPGWTVRALDSDSLSAFLPSGFLDDLRGRQIPPEALSDLIRFELLHRYGGVWADATTVCSRPLDDWLSPAMSAGFFAFSKPGPDRLISTWFLAALKGCLIVRKWRDAAAKYWDGRIERDDYFWPHKLFAALYETDGTFRNLWDSSPAISARHPFHFAPNDSRLLDKPTEAYLHQLSSPTVPVFKLTHKFKDGYGSDSLMATVCAAAERFRPVTNGPVLSRRRVLVIWYGSIPGHGTIGDLKSMESVVSHLVGCGHDVSYSSAHACDIPGATNLHWREVDPADFDAVIFTCGPIIKGHAQTAELFDHFSSKPLAAVGVSLFPEGTLLHANPFDKVFAREGMETAFGDVAIVAPCDVRTPSAHSDFIVGLSLRGPQSEYGRENCASQETQDLTNRLAATALQQRPGYCVNIENHLTRSGKTAAQIEADYGECDLVITSRFHGAVEALRHGVPFIAIDQIKGGAKIYRLLSGRGWSHVYKIDEACEEVLEKAVHSLVYGHEKEALTATHAQLVVSANVTLCALDDWLVGLPSR